MPMPCLPADKAPVGEREEGEERTAEHALGEGSHGRPVVGDTGRLELLVHEARVRLGRAVEDRHPFERHSVDERRHDEANGGPYFVVGIRRRHDLGGMRGTGAGTVELETEAPDRGGNSCVGALDACDARDHPDRCVLGDCAQQSGAGHRQLLWQVQHDRAQIPEDRGPVPYRGHRRVHQVALVVPPGRERGARSAIHANDVGRTAARAHEAVERNVVALGELAVCGDERLLCCRVLRDRGEHARLARECPAHRGAEHRCGHRSTAGRGEAGRAEQLRDPVDGEEGDARDAGAAIGHAPERARPEHPARRHADVVRGDDDAHRRERLAVLACRDRVAQRTSGREAVRDGDEVDP
jgi:hypothetical protein